MEMIILLANLVCVKPQITNISNLPWNPKDEYNLSIATKRCPVKYPNSPCLKKFVKVRDSVYRAICGKNS